MRALVCRLDAMWCAVPLEHVAEVMRPRALSPLQDGPPSVAGLALIRGRFVPLIDLGQLLLGRTQITSRWLSLRMNDRHAAIAVGDVLGISTLDEGATEPWPALMDGTKTDAVSTFGVRDQQLLTVLSLTRIVSALPETLTKGTTA